MMTDIGQLIRLLRINHVEFIVIGGVAAVAHGSGRATFDLDIVYSRTNANIERLSHALAPHSPYLRGAPPGLPFKFDPATIRAGLNFTLITRLGDLDLLGEAGRQTYEQLLTDTVELSAFGIEVRFLTLRKLIEVKREAGRRKDLEAVAELELLLERQPGGHGGQGGPTP